MATFHGSSVAISRTVKGITFGYLILCIDKRGFLGLILIVDGYYQRWKVILAHVHDPVAVMDIFLSILTSWCHIANIGRVPCRQ